MSITTSPRLVVTVPLADVDPRAQAVAFIAATPGPVLTDLTIEARGWLGDCFPAEADVIASEEDTSIIDVWASVASEHATGIRGFVQGEGYDTGIPDGYADVADDRADMIESSPLDVDALLAKLLA